MVTRNRKIIRIRFHSETSTSIYIYIYRILKHAGIEILKLGIVIIKAHTVLVLNANFLKAVVTREFCLLYRKECHFNLVYE